MEGEKVMLGVMVGVMDTVLVLVVDRWSFTMPDTRVSTV